MLLFCKNAIKSAEHVQVELWDAPQHFGSLRVPIV
jgi:hypothetical protein